MVDLGIMWGDLIGIRPLQPTDAMTIRRYYADPDVSYYLFEDLGGPVPSTFMLGLWILSRWMSNSPNFAIVEKSGRLIGEVRLWRVSEANKAAMLTIFIGEKNLWGKGYGTDALRLVLHHAFDRMDLHRVELHVFGFNRRAIRSYEKVGFVLEGTRREALRRRGTHHDILVMGILRDEFYAREALLGKPGFPV